MLRGEREEIDQRGASWTDTDTESRRHDDTDVDVDVVDAE